LVREEIDRRARRGWSETVYQLAKRAGTVRKYSDTLLMFHAKARMPEYRDKQQVELSGKDGGPIETRGEQVLTLRPTDFSDDDLEYAITLFERALARRQAQGDAHGHGATTP